MPFLLGRSLKQSPSLSNVSQKRRIVAVKKVLPEYLADRDSREAFKEEVKIMSPLKHSNCVFLYGASKLASEELALIMEFAGRGSLSDTIDLQDHKSICWATVLEGVVM